MTADFATLVSKMRRVPRAPAILLVVLLSGACASRTPPRVSPADLARAQVLASAGCYTCLVEALAIYEKAGPSQAAFETALFVALREKELGIPEEASIEKARALAPPAPSAPSAPLLLETAALAPMEPTGRDPDKYSQHNARERRTRLSELRALVDTVPPTLLTTYLKITLDCDDPRARVLIKPAELLAAHGDAPILKYRLSMCGVGERQALDAIRDADRRWTEIAFFQARRAAASRPPNLRTALDLFNIVVPAFPTSASMVLARAHAERAYGDLEPALASYDKTIALIPTSRDALLGRVITLSYLERHAEAVETATRMIDLGTWLMGDAYYWRARSRYVLKMVDEAWSDAEHAVKLAPNTNVYTLAGVIAYDRKDLEIAKDRFDNARRLDQGNCTAHSYYALVHVAQSHWPQATPVFSQAMTCFVQASAQTRRELAELAATEFDPVYKARLIADQQKTLKESELKGAQAGYNAAQGFLRAGNHDQAAAHLDVALNHPELQSQAATLRKLIHR
jgi:tetratricopeptide (TPR) repeat protein